MSVIVFLGPTLSREEARSHLDAVYLPPAAHGDVYRAAKERPFAIGIVDGYFERIPAVWHKEILWTLSQGIHVLGAASMGALRAAELAPFGMEGVGAVYEAFGSGALEDDDEVAVAHGDAETDFRATSEAMVNVRATLRAAEAEGVASAATRARVEAVAKSCFYPDRSYPLLFARAIEQGAPAAEVEALRAFASNGRVDQKRLDALSLLDVLRDRAASRAPPRPITFSFAHTEAWDQVVDWADGQPPITKEGGPIPVDRLAAEVRLEGPHARAILAAGLNRAAASALARRSRLTDDDERSAATDQRLRREHAAHGEPDFERWIEAQGLTHETYRTFVRREADLVWLRRRFRHELDLSVADELRARGDYARYARRAEEKQALLAAHGMAEPTLTDAGIDESDLLAWYFERHGSFPIDVEGFIAEVGVPSVSALREEALREYLFERISKTAL